MSTSLKIDFTLALASCVGGNSRYNGNAAGLGRSYRTLFRCSRGQRTSAFVTSEAPRCQATHIFISLACASCVFQSWHEYCISHHSEHHQAECVVGEARPCVDASYDCSRLPMDPQLLSAYERECRFHLGSTWCSLSLSRLYDRAISSFNKQMLRRAAESCRPHSSHKLLRSAIQSTTFWSLANHFGYRHWDPYGRCQLRSIAACSNARPSGRHDAAAKTNKEKVETVCKLL